MTKEDIIYMMEKLKSLALYHANPFEPFVEDWEYVYTTANEVCEELKDEC